MNDESGCPCEWAKIQTPTGIRIGLYHGPGCMAENPEVDGHYFHLTGNPADAWISESQVEWMTGDDEVEAQMRFVLEAIASDRDFSPAQQTSASRCLAETSGDAQAVANGLALISSVFGTGLPASRDGFCSERKDGCVGDTLIAWRWIVALADDTLAKGLPAHDGSNPGI